MEYTLLKLAALAILFTVVLPIFKYYIREKAKQKPKVQQDESFRELLTIKSIYERERKPYALEARAIFNSLCKQGNLHRNELVLIRKLLEECMGEYKHEYDNMKFKNEFHRIYAYLQNWHIDRYQWVKIIDFMNEIHEFVGDNESLQTKPVLGSN
jgi:hypothetical protein